MLTISPSVWAISLVGVLCERSRWHRRGLLLDAFNNSARIGDGGGHSLWQWHDVGYDMHHAFANASGKLAPIMPVDLSRKRAVANTKDTVPTWIGLVDGIVQNVGVMVEGLFVWGRVPLITLP